MVNNKRAVKPAQLQQLQQQSDGAGAQQQALQDQLQLQQRLSAAAPNMPEFTLKDLQFILTFTGELCGGMEGRCHSP